MEMTFNNLCDSCTNIGCEFQSGIVRTECAFYMPSHIEPDNCGNYVVQEPTTKNDLGVDCISRVEVIDYLCKHCPDDGECFKDCDEIKHLRQMPSVTPQESKTGHWIVQPSNKEQGERDFIWWRCSECGQVIFSETEKDRKEFHAFCGRCGADMREVEE